MVLRLCRFVLLPFIAALASSAGAAHPLLLDGAVAGPGVIAVGERGTILRSDDSGRTWATVAAPATATLTGVSFAPDGRHGWAVGHDALILGTDDGGVTWAKAWQGADLESSFLDVCALDTRHVIAVGAYGLFVESTDGGHTWSTRRVLDDDRHLNRVTRGPDGTLYLAGEHGTLLRSRDDGASWQSIASAYDGSFYGLLPLPEHGLLAYGLRGHVFRSTDDGDHWKPVALGEPLMLATAVRTRSGAVWLAGQARALLVSHDGGVTFLPSSAEPAEAIAELVIAPDGSVIALGETGPHVLPSP